MIFKRRQPEPEPLSETTQKVTDMLTDLTDKVDYAVLLLQRLAEKNEAAYEK